MNRAEAKHIPILIKESIYPTGIRYLRSWQKRAFDITGGLLLTPIAAIAVVGGAIAIKLDDGGKVFHVAKVVGPRGAVINQYKLRTMRVDDGSIRHDPANPKEIDLQRVTRVGKFLRRWSIDELPQVWNILCGDMYLVGNRPVFRERIDAWRGNEYLEEVYYGWAHSSNIAKPGCANEVLLNGRSLLDKTLEGRRMRMQLEKDFLARDSLARDMKVLIQNILGVFRRIGAE